MAFLTKIGFLARLALIAASVMSLALLAIFAWKPAWPDAVGKWWRTRAVAEQVQRYRLTMKGAQEGHDAERAALESWNRDLSSVRKLDTFAPMRRFALQRLLALSEIAGEPATAIAYARRLTQFDDRDLNAAATLGRLLGASPQTREEALTLLRKLVRRVPDHAALVSAYCGVLVKADRRDDASAVLSRAEISLSGNVWTVAWGSDARRSTWFRPRRLGKDRIEMAFTIEEAVEGLHFRLPQFFAAELRDLTISVGSGVERDLADWKPRLTSLRQNGDALVAFGAEDPQIEIDVSAGSPCFVRVRARMTTIRADWVHEVADLHSLRRSDGR